MGMSADFETAILYGATHVRVGSAIFGARAEAAQTAPSAPFRKHLPANSSRPA